jgi:hypothetical protein
MVSSHRLTINFNGGCMEAYEKIVMQSDTLDDGSAVINFDVTDDYNIPTQQGGYVMARMDKVVGEFIVTVFNADGDVLSETVVPFNFKQ